jgi:peptide/nickel transport system ATP-binding protein
LCAKKHRQIDPWVAQTLLEGTHPQLEVDAEMTKQAFDQVIQRASSDARFKASLNDNFDGTVRGYDLSNDEKARLANGLGMSGAARAYAMPSAIAASTTADSVTADSVTADSVTADSVTADSVTADSVTADSVTADSVTADSVTADSVMADSVTADSATTN